MFKNQLLKYFLISIFAFGAGSIYTLNFDTTNQTAAVSNSQSNQKITSFALYNASTDQFIQNIENGSVIDLEKTGDKLAIVAKTDPATVGSVEFILSGDESKLTSDNNPTYAFPGNSTTNNGSNLYAWRAKTGNYTLSARAFTSKSLRGSSGIYSSVNFKIGVNIPEEDEDVFDPADLAISKIEILNANTGAKIADLTDELVLTKDSQNTPFVLFVKSENIEKIGSVFFDISGNKKDLYFDNLSPYVYPEPLNQLNSVAIGVGTGGFNSVFSESWSPEVGEYVISVTPYQSPESTGNKGPTFVGKIVVKNQDTNPPLDINPPDKPILSVKPGSLTQNSVSIIANSTDKEGSVTYYSFFRTKEGSTNKISLGNIGIGQVLQDINLEPNSTYNYFVAATDNSENRSLESKITITTLPIPEPVYSTRFKAGDNVKIINIQSLDIRESVNGGVLLGNITNGAEGIVLSDNQNGLVSSDGYIRWKVSFPSLNIQGWVAEKSLLGNVFWLEKYTPLPIFACSDQLDNDNDGKIDFPSDLGCSSLNDDDEYNQIINPPSSGAGPTYYVDSVSGNDNNNGTSVNTPWKSVNKVNSTKFTAGSNILFKNDSVFSGQVLDIPSSGNTNNWITFGAYGSGTNKPKLGGVTSNGVSYFIVKDIGIDNISSGNCLVLENGGYVEIINVTADKCAGNGFRAKGTAGSTTPINHVTISGSFVRGTSGATDGITLHRGANYAEAGSYFNIINNVVTGFSEQSLDITAADNVEATGNLLFGSSNSVNIGHGVKNINVAGNMLDGAVIIKDSENVSFVNNFLLNGNIQINRNATGSAGATDLVDRLLVAHNYIKNGGISYASSSKLSNGQVRNNIMTNPSLKTGVVNSNNTTVSPYVGTISSYPVGSLPSNIWNVNFPESFRQQSVQSTIDNFKIKESSSVINSGYSSVGILKDFFGKIRDGLPDIGPVESN